MMSAQNHPNGKLLGSAGPHAPRDPGELERLINDLRQTNDMLEEVISSQNVQLDRIMGTVAEVAARSDMLAKNIAGSPALLLQFSHQLDRVRLISQLCLEVLNRLQRL